MQGPAKSGAADYRLLSPDRLPLRIPRHSSTCCTLTLPLLHTTHAAHSPCSRLHIHEPEFPQQTRQIPRCFYSR